MSENEFENEKLEHRKAYDVETHYRELISRKERTKITTIYQIHRDRMIAERFFPLLKYSDGRIKKGFTHNNSVQFKGNFTNLQPFMRKLDKNNGGYDVWVINKKQAQQFLFDIGYRGADEEEKKTAEMLDQLSYQTVRKEISAVLTKQQRKRTKTVGEAKEILNKYLSNKNKDFIKDKVTLPILR